ncbi:hypothetical protein A2714_01170 [Candidatus Woesebacteria bacterium RIFCSPHIGHO2_01_FULL_38_9]|uniref:DNA polymerase III delta N-terminal domain-containing protein n=2 Tax=Candidatus Woeseibacteriota TaxID=1752722 RepID=A0A1F7XYS5_9BACT|nr:MAG: hypothetical protein A2714_01170 [Candidatus Woesebacteria bacterium RIFCSPHIGHO2_01_FULL_38_9]OGM59789.1 MAG: hypothetical protein A3A75_00310 [Candidatus Woesebacteria bacterium RIFCSPLOWO2_01_FULL_39_10]
MRLIVLHGDNTLESYERLQKFVEVAHSRVWKVQRAANSSQNLAEVIVSDTLFQEKRLVVIEDWRLFNKSNLKLLKSKSDELDITIIIYHQGNLTKTFLKSLPRIDKIEEFKLPKLIWTFLDSFYPGNAKMLFQLLHEITKNEPAEFVFSLLAKQLRDLYWVKTDSSSIPYPSWRVGKLKGQSSKFTTHQLTNLISNFAEIDIKSKTSDTKLIDLLDFTIATKLE